MKRDLIQLIAILIFAFTINSCQKFSTDNNDISEAIKAPVVPISDAAPLCGSISGTMLSGKTYIINCDIYIQKGDSLVIEPCVKIIFRNKAGMIVKGNIFSLFQNAKLKFFVLACCVADVLE